MSKLGIGIGTSPNDGKGDPLRIAMNKINSNFTEIYDTLGDGNNVISYANTAGISTLARNLTGNPIINISGLSNTGITTTEHIEVTNITSTGVITATQFVGDGSQLTNVSALPSGLEVLDDNVRKGVAKELNFGANIESTGPDGVGRVTISVTNVPRASFASTAGIATVANYASVAGIATRAQGLTGTPNINVGIITASKFEGPGSSLTGIVTYITAGSGISINQSVGNVTVSTSGEGTGIKVKNIYYVTKDGNDNNSGRGLGDAKATIKAAVAVASTSPGAVIKVSAGTYIEDNPITLPDQLSIVGDSLREVTVTPLNTNKDLFYVGAGNYIAEMSFIGAASTGAIFAFDPYAIRYINQSPYIQNCTNFIENSTGLRIDGKKAIGPLKSMVLDSYTQYNQGGIGVSITNEGYAQLVSLFTICNNIAVYCGTGGACDLTNSNSSFGNYGLVADNVGPIKYTGIISQIADANSSTFAIDLNVPIYNVSNAVYDNNTGLTTITTSSNHNFSVGMGVSLNGLQFTCYTGIGTGNGLATYPDGTFGYVFEVKSVPAPNQFTVHVGVSTTPNQVYSSGGTAKIDVVRPFDGQVVYFDTLYYTVDKIIIGSGGTGYTSPPTVTIQDPNTDWGITATAIANISNGSVDAIEIVSNGRGYSSTPPTVTISSPDVGINTATAIAVLIPTYYSIQRSTPISAGICTITVTENIPYAVGLGTTVPFFKQSRVLASGHSFEYIGSGTTISTCLPSTGGVPIQANETDAKNGGLVVYTSTDQAGNFRIGDGVVVNQNTGTISGTFYAKSLFSTMTPFILALGGGD